MPKINLLTHLPRLRMEPDQVPLPWGKLVKVTWESYDRITAHAFSDWAKRYIAADPVFLLAEADVDLPFLRQESGSEAGMLEMKVPNEGWYGIVPQALGSDLLTSFHDKVADKVWAALMLAVPGAALGRPRSSVTFLFPQDGCVEFGGHLLSGIRIQGETDQEYAYSADAACVPLTESDLVRALTLLPVVERIFNHESLHPALDHLLATTDPTLGPGERLMLAVSALEDLLLPEVREGLQDNFAQRVASILGPSAEATARQLYRARSSAFHQGPEALNDTDLTPGLAEQLLADVIVAEAGTPLVFDHSVRGKAPTNRLFPRSVWCSATMTIGASDLRPPDGWTVSWSPLPGLAYELERMAIPGVAATLAPMLAHEIVGMEEKDIRRDFINKFRGEDNPIAGIGVWMSSVDFELNEEVLSALLRPRNLAVVGLRIAGVYRFVDPELLGWYVYRDGLRCRRETVFRQTALMSMGNPTNEVFSADMLEKVRPVWWLLGQYEAGAALPEIDKMLDAFRRAHDPYAPERTRIALFFALLESILGRFRPARSRIPLEHLVAALPYLDPDTAAWFADNGRRLRNESAHGSWLPAEDSDGLESSSLRHVCGAALHNLLETWVNDPHRSEQPSQLLIRSLSGRLP
ncbi:MAG: hypothetical protein ABWY04_13890 [Arthrobacter sp.]